MRRNLEMAAGAPRRTCTLIVRIAFVWLLAIGSGLPANAQFDTGAALGTIKDPSAAGVAGASVELLSIAKGVTVTRKTDASGDFEFDNLQAGDYKISVNASGFEVSSTDPFRVNVGARQRVDLTLKLGSTNDTVIVSGAATLLETDSSGRGGTVESAQAIALPLNGRSTLIWHSSCQGSGAHCSTRWPPIRRVTLPTM